MAKILITPTKAPTQKDQPSPTAADFKRWAEGRTGFTTEELIEIYSRAANLTRKQEDALKAQFKKEEKPAEPKPAPAPRPTTTPKPKTAPEELIITRTPYPKWWKDSLNAKINLTAPDSQTIAVISGHLSLYVSTIVITVTGETQIIINFGTAGSSGPIHLGGPDQPMGIVIAMGNSPAPCGKGPLSILATDPNGANPSIGGFMTCFVGQDTQTKIT